MSESSGRLIQALLFQIDNLLYHIFANFSIVFRRFLTYNTPFFVNIL